MVKNRKEKQIFSRKNFRHFRSPNILLCLYESLAKLFDLFKYSNVTEQSMRDQD